MLLKVFQDQGLAQLSYLCGDGGQAAVIDPRIDIEPYIAAADRAGMQITHIFETHTHEDHLSGARNLAAVTGAPVYRGRAGSADYGEPANDGDEFQLGTLRLNVHETPGHTSDSITIAMRDVAFSAEPIAAFTGDTLLVGDVGRTDLASDPDRAAAQLHDSLFNRILTLGDHVLVYPAHTAGAVCAGRIAPRQFSTIGYERRHNPALKLTDRGEFVEARRAERYGRSPHFATLARLNRIPPLMARLPRAAPYPAAQFRDALAEGMVCVDLRPGGDYASGHIPGALSLPLAQLARYAGWLLPYDRDLGLLLSDYEDRDEAVRTLTRMGFQRLRCHLVEGMNDWLKQGLPRRRLTRLSATTLKRRLDGGEDFLLLDVRNHAEFRRGHLEGAMHVELGELTQELHRVPHDRPIVTFCGDGERATIAAGILRRRGYTDVLPCLDSLDGCQAAGMSVVPERHAA